MTGSAKTLFVLVRVTTAEVERNYVVNLSRHRHKTFLSTANTEVVVSPEYSLPNS